MATKKASMQTQKYKCNFLKIPRLTRAHNLQFYIKIARKNLNLHHQRGELPKTFKNAQTQS